VPEDDSVDFGAAFGDTAEAEVAFVNKLPSLGRIIAKYAGISYRYGGMSMSGADCSGLVCMVFRELGVTGLPRKAGEMSRLGHKVSLKHVRAGDLLFFTNHKRRIDHVGIYTGNGEFIHASVKLGVIISGLADESYRKRLVKIRRILP
jgi:cell wall-associated NlpC family hydrolase